MDHEARAHRAYEAILRPGDVAIDVGAHVGDHTLPMARRVMPSGIVYAFEPLPVCRQTLRANLDREPALKTVVRLFDVALGASAGTAPFVVAEDALAYSGLRERVYDVPTRIKRISVEVRRLDDVLPALSALRYIKIDAEGGELHALRGGQALLERHRPVVEFEFGANSIAEYGITSSDMGAFWLDRGYVLFDVLARSLGTLDDFVASATEQEVWDYVAIPAERSELVDAVLEALATGVATQKLLEGLRRERDYALTMAHENAERIRAMERTKFWKLRKAWFRLRRAVHFPGQE